MDLRLASEFDTPARARTLSRYIESLVIDGTFQPNPDVPKLKSCRPCRHLIEGPGVRLRWHCAACSMLTIGTRLISSKPEMVRGRIQMNEAT